LSSLTVAYIAITFIVADLIITVSLIKLRKDSLSGSLGETIDLKYPEMLDEYWKGGILYYNPSDKRFFVPKKSGLGITINHGRKGLSVLFYIILIGLIILLASG
jgi:uncharacterized membrane protein